MKICATCKKELRCIKNGMNIRFSFDGRHAYKADLYECPICKVKIAFGNQAPIYDEHFKDEDVFMDTTRKEAEKIISKSDRANVTVCPNPLNLGIVNT